MPSWEAYELPGAGPIRQGEILSNVQQLVIEVAGQSTLRQVRPLDHPYAVVVSQDCDLDWDYQNRAANEPDTNPKNLPNVLFCEVNEASVLRGQSSLKSDQWKKVKQNNDPRYQFLEACPSSLDAEGIGFPDLAVDFKRYFTVPTRDVYSHLSQQARRRARLQDTYCAHLCTRFYHFQLRVALPREHGVA